MSREIIWAGMATPERYQSRPMAKRVLVIEDESDILIYLMAVLEDQGYDVRPLDTEAPLAEAIKSGRPDLILLDVMMPVRSGVSIYKELRTSKTLKSIPVIIISGFSSESGSMPGNFRKMIPDRSIPAPEGFIDKPMNLETLISMVHEVTCGPRDMRGKA